MLESLNISFVFAGIVLGFLSGFVPGVGNTIVVILSFPFLRDASMLQILLFYMAVISSSQYSGSIIATVFGVPGESSSLPAVIEGNRLFRKGIGNFAISGAAIGSLFGAFVSVVVVYTILPILLELIKQFYNNNIQLIILLFATISICLLMGKNIIQNFLVFGLGFFLAAIGINSVPYVIVFPEIIPYEKFPKLYGGLPLFPVILSLYVFPVLLQTSENFKDYKCDRLYKDKNTLTEHLKEFIKHIGSSLRGSSFGCFFGLVPHIGTSVCANLSYYVEKKIGIFKGTYKNTGDIKSLISAETSNNSTGMVSLMPLLLLGIPITASEAVLLSIIEMNSFQIDYKTTIEAGLFKIIVLWFIMVNFISFIFAWPLVKFVNLFRKVKINTILMLTALVVICLNYYVGSLTQDGIYYTLVSFFLLPLGFFLRRCEPMIIIVGFILQDKILASLTAFIQINL